MKELETSLRAAGLKPLNVRKHGRILSSILSAAVEDEELASNPAIGRRRRRRSKAVGVKRHRSSKLWPSREEVAKMLTTAQAHAIERKGKMVHPYRPHFPFLLTAARTGMRLSEVLALQWGDIDWQGRRIHVQRAYVKGKIDLPKSGNDRWVDMTNQLHAELGRLYRERQGNVVGLTAEAEQALEEQRGDVLEAWIFTDSEGNLLDDHNLRRRVWKPLLVAAELRRFRLHDLRHAMVSILIAGGELKYAQEQAGHHSPSFTLDVYGHLLPKDRRGVINLLDAPATTDAPVRTLSAPDDSSAPKAAAG